MFLRQLTMRGFKSFADKTVLEFTPGISVIVGPNGSGKSNIADAVAWVLGEQGPRAMRGAQMVDVIFAGSPGRPGLGLAEVSVVVDNTAGLIPLPATEVEISRTLYRSGESEYRLGGRPCRLLDIQELLSDTGLGRAMHTIVGQGHLEDVLSARPEDRRQFVEEAAGIAKHRRRRERAERKLAGLDGDLARLRDLVGELRRQLKPLRQQADLAQRHEELSREAGELALKLAAARLGALYRDRDHRWPAWEAAAARREEARARLSQLDQDISGRDGERAAAEQARADAEARHSEAMGAKSEAEARLRLAIQAEANCRERLSTSANRSGRLFALEEELGRTERALIEVQSALGARQVELEQAEEGFRRMELARRLSEEDRRRLQEEAARRVGEIESVRRALDGSRSERAVLAQASRDVGSRATEADGRVQALGVEIERLDSETRPLTEERTALERERAAVAESVAGLDATEQGFLARREVLEARRAELSESPGAAYARRRGHRPLGLLRDLIDAPPHLRLALRAALGPFADAVVYASHQEALADATADEGGGVTLAVAVPADDEVAGALVPSATVLGGRRLLDSLRPSPKVEALAHRLLGSVILVGGVAEAAAKHRVHPHLSFVTPEGTVVGPAFVQTTSALDHRLDGVRRDVAALDRELGGLRRRRREAGDRLSEIDARGEALARETEEADRRITEAAEAMAAAQREAAALRHEERSIADRLSAAEASVRSLGERLAASAPPAGELPPLPPLAEPPVHLRVEVEALRREQARMEAGVGRARRDIEALAVEDPEALVGELVEAEAGRRSADQDLRQLEAEQSHAVATYRAAAEGSAIALARHAEVQRAWREQAALVDRLRDEDAEEDRVRTDLQRRVADAERILRQGHGVDPEGTVRALAAEDTVEDLQRRSDLVARRLALLGRINMLAVGELQTVQDRHDFVARELEDVNGARADLRRLIGEIDGQMAALFEGAFRDVAREFADLFGVLFPGGEGRLYLTDPEDPLGAGIDVEARPGRKKVKRLSLLSGGERSLCALAFLFAIFRARPSPFYLLDEVEAALDDVNLHRFLDALRALGSASQVLVVTHQKRTMEMADVLYGVSMTPDGASKVVSQRLPEMAGVASPAGASPLD